MVSVLELEHEESEGGARRLLAYAGVWLLNKAGLPLHYRRRVAGGYGIAQHRKVGAEPDFEKMKQEAEEMRAANETRGVGSGGVSGVSGGGGGAGERASVSGGESSAIGGEASASATVNPRDFASQMRQWASVDTMEESTTGGDPSLAGGGGAEAPRSGGVPRYSKGGHRRSDDPSLAEALHAVQSYDDVELRVGQPAMLSFTCAAARCMLAQILHCSQIGLL